MAPEASEVHVWMEPQKQLNSHRVYLLSQNTITRKAKLRKPSQERRVASQSYLFSINRRPFWVRYCTRLKHGPCQTPLTIWNWQSGTDITLAEKRGKEEYRTRKMLNIPQMTVFKEAYTQSHWDLSYSESSLLFEIVFACASCLKYRSRRTELDLSCSLLQTQNWARNQVCINIP